MALSNSTRRAIAFLTVVVVASFLNFWALGQANDTLYDNALQSCQRQNPVREAVVLATRTAASTAEHGREQYAEATQHILAQPFVNPANGSVNCLEAIKHP